MRITSLPTINKNFQIHVIVGYISVTFCVMYYILDNATILKFYTFLPQPSLCFFFTPLYWKMYNNGYQEAKINQWKLKYLLLLGRPEWCVSLSDQNSPLNCRSDRFLQSYWWVVLPWRPSESHQCPPYCGTRPR